MNDKPLPKYMQLKQEILEWFTSGRLKPGEQMPSENEIADQYGMSRQTVRQTFGQLEREGWLQRVQGKGTFVSAPPQGSSGTQVAQTIGLITTYMSDYIFPHIVRGVEAALRAKGYRLLLSSTDNDKEKEQECLTLMMSQPLSGLIIEPTKSAEGNPNLAYFLSLEYEGIPYLMINEGYHEVDCPVLKLDDELGGYRAADHLISLGHRKIAGFFKIDDNQGVNRLKGFLRAHREHKVPLAPELVIRYATEERRDKPYEAAVEMLRKPDGERPTAFVCYNDELAVRLLDAVRQSGFTVPADLSMVGFDDSSLATATEVKLTSMTHPKFELGFEAGERLIAMIEDGSEGDSASCGRVYEPELVIRESVRAIEKKNG